MCSQIAASMMLCFISTFFGKWPATLKQHELVIVPGNSPAIHDANIRALNFARSDLASIVERIKFWESFYHNAINDSKSEKLTMKYRDQLFKARREYLRYFTIVEKHPELLPSR
jgi:predicted nuclease of restriction endonuclease-like RecB superfamily